MTAQHNPLQLRRAHLHPYAQRSNVCGVRS